MPQAAAMNARRLIESIRPVANYATLLAISFLLSITWLLWRGDDREALRAVVANATGALFSGSGIAGPLDQHAKLANSASASERKSQGGQGMDAAGWGVGKGVDDPANQQRQEAIAVVAQISAQATEAPDATTRARALDQLGELATPEALQALDLAVTSDEDPRNRVRAINALQRLAAQSAAAPQAVSILQRAMNDPNSYVAARASAAYQQLTTATEDPQPGNPDG